jgi:hypothetical protein
MAFIVVEQVLPSFYGLLGNYNEMTTHELSSGKIADTHAAVDSMAPRKICCERNTMSTSCDTCVAGSYGGDCTTDNVYELLG